MTSRALGQIVCSVITSCDPFPHFVATLRIQKSARVLFISHTRYLTLEPQRRPFETIPAPVSHTMFTQTHKILSSLPGECEKANHVPSNWQTIVESLISLSEMEVHI